MDVATEAETVVAEINRLLDNHTDAEIAELLNAHGMISGEGKRFNRLMVVRIRTNYRLESRYSRLRTRSLLSLEEIAACLDVTPDTIKIWRRAGLLKAHPYDDKGQCLFEPPGQDAPIKYRRQDKTRRKSTASQASVTPPN